MALFFDAATVGFFDEAIHAEIPEGAIEITAERHQELLEGQASGLRIAPDGEGRPVLLDPPVASEEDLLSLERSRMIVSRFQARAALHFAGLLPAAEEAVDAAEPITQIAWRDAQEWRRDSPTISTIAEALGLTDLQIDDLFRSAAQITA